MAFVLLTVANLQDETVITQSIMKSQNEGSKNIR